MITMVNKLEPPTQITNKLKSISFIDDFTLLDNLIKDKQKRDIILQEHWIYIKALKFIAEGCKQPKEIAAEALKTLERQIKR